VLTWILFVLRTRIQPFLAIGCSLICLKLLQGDATPS
jgi:hypothetical protein